MKTRHRGPNASVYKCFYRPRYAVMPQNCFVPECKKKVYVENGVKIPFHTFPEERKLFMKRIVAIRRDIGKHLQVTTHTRVRSRHFKPSHYRPSLTGRKRTLKPTAVPSVFHWKKRSPVKWKAPTRRSPIGLLWRIFSPFESPWIYHLLGSKGQMSRQEVVETQSIASLRIHVKRGINKIKKISTYGTV